MLEGRNNAEDDGQYIAAGAASNVGSLRNIASTSLSFYLKQELFRKNITWTRSTLTQCCNCISAKVVCDELILRLLEDCLCNELGASDAFAVLEVFLELYPHIDKSVRKDQLIRSIDCQQFDLALLLLNHGWNVNYVHYGVDGPTTALSVAVKTGDKAVRLLLDHGADACAGEDISQMSSSHLVSSGIVQDRMLVKLLAEKTLDRLAGLEQRQLLLDTLLCRSIVTSQVYVDIFLELGASPNTCISQSYGRTRHPLEIALNERSIDSCRALINAGADVNVVLRHGQLIDTPLMIAASRQYYSAVKLFLCSSADVFFTDSQGQTPLTSTLSNIHEGQPPLTAMILLRCNSPATGLGAKCYTHYVLRKLLEYAGNDVGLQLLTVGSSFDETDLRLFRDSIAYFPAADFISSILEKPQYQPLSLLDISRREFRREVRKARRNIIHVMKVLGLPYSLFCYLLLSDIVVRGPGIEDAEQSSRDFDSDAEIASLYAEAFK